MIKKLPKHKFIVFLPCRKGSERVVNKNTKKFANIKNGLISIKLKQLLAVEEISEIFLSTNDEKIINYAASIDDPRIIIDKRSEELCNSLTSTDDLINYASSKLDGTIIWTHVTSPFVSSSVYAEAIKLYLAKVVKGDYDSLVTTNKVQKFLWDDNGPINYNREIEKWPRTQTLPVLHELNSGIFIADSSIYKHNSDRIGAKPYLMSIDENIAFDIDWEHDWTLAEQIYMSKIANI